MPIFSGSTHVICCASSAAGQTPPHVQSSQLLRIDDLEVYVSRKRIKNINLRVKPSSQSANHVRVEVSAPLRMREADIVSFVRTKRSWIDKSMARIANSPGVKASTATPSEIAEWKGIVSAATAHLVEKWEPILGVRVKKLAFRNMTSRWGSCQPATGRVCINVRLALYPPECLEYVVVHELCHFLESGHGARFKELMDAALPDWRSRRAKLR